MAFRFLVPVVIVLLALATGCRPGDAAPGNNHPGPTESDRERARLGLQLDIAAFALQVDAAARGDADALAAMRLIQVRMRERLVGFEDPRPEYLQEVAPDRQREHERAQLESAVINLDGHLGQLAKLAPDVRRQREASVQIDQALRSAYFDTEGIRDRLVQGGESGQAVIEVQQQMLWLESVRANLRKVVADEDAHNAANAARRDFARWRDSLAAQRDAPWRRLLLKSTAGGDELDPLIDDGQTLAPLLETIAANPTLTRDARREATWAKRIFNAYPEAPGRDTPPAFD